MIPRPRPYLVTLRLDATRTYDIRVHAPSHWVAWWLARRLHPGIEILGVREVRGD